MYRYPGLCYESYFAGLSPWASGSCQESSNPTSAGFSIANLYSYIPTWIQYHKLISSIGFSQIAVSIQHLLSGLPLLPLLHIIKFIHRLIKLHVRNLKHTSCHSIIQHSCFYSTSMYLTIMYNLYLRMNTNTM